MSSMSFQCLQQQQLLYRPVRGSSKTFWVHIAVFNVDVAATIYQQIVTPALDSQVGKLNGPQTAVTRVFVFSDKVEESTRRHQKGEISRDLLE